MPDNVILINVSDAIDCEKPNLLVLTNPKPAASSVFRPADDLGCIFVFQLVVFSAIPMASIEVLFSLIRSMTKSEKRYFRLASGLQSGPKSYLVLFDFLDKAPTYDEHTVEKLNDLLPSNTIEPARKHLHRMILRSLRLYDAEKDIESRLSNLLHEARILYNKGLAKMAFEQLARAKSLARKREKFIFYILAAKQELRYLVSSHFVGMDEYLLLEKQKEISSLLQQEARIHQHATLHEVLLLRYWKNGIARSKRESLMLNDLLLEEYQLLNAPGEKPFTLLEHHLHFQSTYFQMTGNPGGSLKVFYDLDALFQQHTHLWKDEPASYFNLLDGILFDLRWMDRYDDMDFFVGHMKEMEATENMKTMITLRVLEHELNKKVDQGKGEEALALLEKEFSTANRNISQLPLRMYSSFMFAMVRVRMVNSEYSKALKLISRMLNMPSSTMNQAQHVFFQLINLQVTALLNDNDNLHYVLRSVERKLKSERKLHGVEQLIIQTLKRRISSNPVNDVHASTEALEENPHERLLLKELCVKWWLKKLVTP